MSRCNICESKLTGDVHRSPFGFHVSVFAPGKKEEKDEEKKSKNKHTHYPPSNDQKNEKYTMFKYHPHFT